MYILYPSKNLEIWFAKIFALVKKKVCMGLYKRNSILFTIQKRNPGKILISLDTVRYVKNTYYYNVIYS